MSIEQAVFLALVFGTGIGLIVGILIGGHIASSAYRKFLGR